MIVKTNMPITVENGKLEIPHLGISLRAMMGAAIKNLTHLTYQTGHLVPIYYKSTQVATVNLGKDFR